MKPLHTFKIKANYKTSHFCEVNIHKTFKGMEEHCHWFKLGKKCRASFSPETHYCNDRRTHQIGQFNFQIMFLGSETIAHECAHAALTYARRKRLDLSEKYGGGAMHQTCDEERFCYAVGYMMKQIVTELYKSKIW